MEGPAIEKTFHRGERLLLECSLVFMLVLGCMPAQPQSKSQRLYVVAGENANGSIITVKQSQILLIELPEQLSSGYSWKMVHLDLKMWGSVDLPRNAINRLMADGIITPRADPRGPFGTIEPRVFRLEPKKRGRSTIEITEARPWEPDSPRKKCVLHVVTTK
jgi:hypothetical protein